jgi:uncharacterized membrane protein
LTDTFSARNAKSKPRSASFLNPECVQITGVLNMDDSSTSNPLPLDAEHSPAPAPAEIHDSNPLPPSEIPAVQTPVIVDHADSNPLPESQPNNPVPAAQNDLLVPAMGYVFGLLALISLLGQNTKAKFHAAQAFAYWFLISAIFVPVFIITGILASVTGPIGFLINIAALGLFGLIAGIAIPIYLVFQTYKGVDVELPVVGKMLAEKIGYVPNRQ